MTLLRSQPNCFHISDLKKKFIRKCSELREKLTPDKLRRGHNLTENLNITAATFSTTIQEIWTSIMNNEYLNIPSSNDYMDKNMAEMIMKQILDSKALTQAERIMKSCTHPHEFNTRLDQYLQSIQDRLDDAAEGLTNSVKRQVRRQRREMIINEQKSKFRDVLSVEREKRTEENKRTICTKMQNMKKGFFSSIFTFSFDFKAFEDLQVDNVINPYIRSFNDSFNTYVYFDEYVELVNECKSRHNDDLKEYVEKEADRLQWRHQIIVGIGKVSLLLLAAYGAYVSGRPVFHAVKFLVLACGSALLKFEKPAIDGLTYIYEKIILPAAKQSVKSAVPKIRHEVSTAMLVLLMQYMSREKSLGN